MAKSYCYKGECKAVETGFRLEVYKVCAHCKEEISDMLYDRIKKGEQEKAQKEEEEKDDEDPYSMWHFF